MDRRALSLGGFVVAGASQLLLGIVQYVDASGPTDPLFSVLGGLLLSVVFGRALLRGDDLNGLATRPLFVVVGVLAGVFSALLTVAAVFAA